LQGKILEASHNLKARVEKLKRRAAEIQPEKRAKEEEEENKIWTEEAVRRAEQYIKKRNKGHAWASTINAAVTRCRSPGQWQIAKALVEPGGG
jgi:hypothetical protein